MEDALRKLGYKVNAIGLMVAFLSWMEFMRLIK